ncbi:MAG: type II toxin-antitoxin system RelE/ParE family toxin [Bdellovibrionales bacterium]|nr:type II toxin-antitoxin system RelE/ParE family toxin [Bdellovibrionales bacterium]
MKILQTNTFYKAVKKLKKNQKKILDEAVRCIVDKPLIGERKVGDLKGVYVYKFSMIKQQALLAYTYKKGTLTLLAFDSHENFYRSLKKSSLHVKK